MVDDLRLVGVFLTLLLDWTACLIVKGDVVNFTVWASVREPAQVFTLLEGVYNSFDAIAKQRKVFKVRYKISSYASCGLLRLARTMESANASCSHFSYAHSF